jgi:uncharacterized membrane protein YfcA
VIGGAWVEVVALVAAFAVAVITTPAGVSGAVLLLPFQVSVLGTPSPSVTPTNLLYNVVACPGAMWRYWRQGQTGGALTWLLLAGTLPGVVAGSAALSSTFVTSLGGVVTFSLLSISHQGSIAPDWPTGIALGIGGLAGGYAGARMHARMPETLIRRLLALVVVAIGIRFLVAGLTGGT